MKKNSIIKTLSIGLSCVLLSACSTLFDTDNTPSPTPLTNFNAEITPHELWNRSPNSGVGRNCNDYLKLAVASNCNAVFTASRDGKVSATEKNTGRSLWNTEACTEITAGPGIADGLVYVGGADGTVVALRQDNGGIVWRAKVATEILAAPAGANGIVLIKTVDGHLYGLSAKDGHSIWSYQQTEPTLILRGSSTPAIAEGATVAGFANGNLVKLSLTEGTLHWQQAIASAQGTFPVQRMIDIDANPIIYNHTIYAVTYQGQIGSLDFASGKIYWLHELSSFTGITTDGERVYVTDACGNVWAFDSRTGGVIWRQTQLLARNLTAPVIMGCYVVVGDAEGYLHWLSKVDGHFAARTKMDSSGILATPIVDQGILYVVARNGDLAAYSI